MAQDAGEEPAQVEAEHQRELRVGRVVPGRVHGHQDDAGAAGIPVPGKIVLMDDTRNARE
jgi:hypothetical protein